MPDESPTDKSPTDRSPKDKNHKDKSLKRQKTQRQKAQETKTTKAKFLILRFCLWGLYPWGFCPWGFHPGFHNQWGFNRSHVRSNTIQKLGLKGWFHVFDTREGRDYTIWERLLGYRSRARYWELIRER